MAAAASKITVEIGGRIAASLTQSLRDAQRQVSTLGRNISRSMADASKGFKNTFRDDAFQLAATAAAGIGLALNNSVKAATGFQTVLADIGKTSGASNSELQKLGAQLRGLSIRNRTNLAPTVLAAGVQDLVAQGLDLQDAVASIEALGRVATATGSELTDVTKTGFQLQNALKIKPTELKSTFDALAYAGKQGAFELKDMAQFMPTIAAAAGSLGIQGRKGAVSLAAMMQMVRKDAPDAGQAATRLTDAMLKMTAPQTVKNFAKFGVNIEKVLKDAQKRGINPMEAALDTLMKVTKGDSFKLGEIFGDKEAKLALMSLMKYREEYARLRDEAGGSAAAGTVDKDYLRSIDTFQGRLTTFQNSMQNLGIVVGNALMPPLAALADFLTPVFETIGRMADQFPTLTGVVVGLAAAFVGLVAVAPFIASLMSVVSGLGITMGGIAAVATGPIGLTIAAIVGIGAALVAAYDRVGWFRAAVDGAMAKVRQLFTASFTAISGALQGFIKYLGGAWKVLTGVLTLNPKQIGQGASEAFGGIKKMATAWLGWMDTLWPGVQQGATKAWAGLKGAASSAMDGAKAAFAGAANGVKGAWAGITSWFSSLWQQLQGAASSVMQGVKAAFAGAVSGIKGAWSGITGWFANLWQQILGAGLQQVLDGAVQIFRGYLDVVRGVWSAIVGIFTGDSEKAVAGVRQIFGGFRGIFAGVANMAQGAFGLLTSYLSTLWQNFTTLAQAAWRGIASAAASAWQGIVAAAQGAWNSVVAAAASIPGRLASAWQMISSAAASAWQSIVAAARGAWQGIVGAAQGAWNSIVAAAASIPGRLTAAWQMIKQGAISAFQQLVAFIRTVPSMLVGVGQAIIDTIIDGIKARAAALVATVRQTFAEVRKLMPFSDAKEGPFQHLTASGKAIMATLASGVGAGSPRLQAAMEAAAGSAMRAMNGVTSAMPAVAASEAMPAVAASEAMPAVVSSEAMPEIVQAQPQLTAAGVPVRSQHVVPQYAPQPERQQGGFLQGLMPLLGRVASRFAPQARGYLELGNTLLGSLREGNILPSLEAGLGAAARQFLPQAGEFVGPLMRGLGSVAAPQLEAPVPAAAGASMGGMTMSPTVNVNVSNSNASADDIASKVMEVFSDMLSEAEAGVRAYLND